MVIHNTTLVYHKVVLQVRTHLMKGLYDGNLNSYAGTLCQHTASHHAFTSLSSLSSRGMKQVDLPGIYLQQCSMYKFERQTAGFCLLTTCSSRSMFKCERQRAGSLPCEQVDAYPLPLISTCLKGIYLHLLRDMTSLREGP